MKDEALNIALSAIRSALPYENTLKILEGINIDKLSVISVGKAAVPMARAAETVFGNKIENGLLITKHGHSKGFSSSLFTVLESGHPISDEISEAAAEKALELASFLGEGDTLLVLLSGGASALAEKSIIDTKVYRDIMKTLLLSGADIKEINTVRKRLSYIKGGRLAVRAYPARVITVALSDVLSNDKEIIASAPTVRDTADIRAIEECIRKYLPGMAEKIKGIYENNADGLINDGGYYFAGDINILCDAAGKKASELGFRVHHMERNITGEASLTATRLISSIPFSHGRHCYIWGGECTVTVKGNGKGGRNQEAALKAAICLEGKEGIAFLSVGSDGTDGPTDAAGGYADGKSLSRMREKGIDAFRELENNNSYEALTLSGDIIITGPTGTNVNDLIIILTDEYGYK